MSNVVRVQIKVINGFMSSCVPISWDRTRIGKTGRRRTRQ